MKIAVIGSGISGLAAAHFLSDAHDVNVFEANDYIGGHTATIDVTVGGKEYAIDTGFIVFNNWNYPHFSAFLEKLNIDVQNTEMGFSVSEPETDFEYCGNNLNTLFAKRSNLFNVNFHRMLKDIMRFNRQAKADYAQGRIDERLSLEDYLKQGSYGALFQQKYLLPMAAAIWSSSLKTVAEFQALFFIRFFYNHGLLNINDRPQWKVLKGGSRSYIPSITQPYKDKIFLNSKVSRVTRHPDYVEIEVNGDVKQFDQVVMACHSDQALAMLSDASEQEKEVLGAIEYLENSVVLHTDISLLPRRTRAWASWNYQLTGDDTLPLLTYDMNILQGIESDTTFCVTVNGDEYIDAAKVLRRFRYAHPQFSQNSVKAQARWQDINGVNRSWFCGAYWRNGFHEDGFVSAMWVAKGLQDLKGQNNE